MAIRSEKKKVLQQIVNREDSSLDIDPESLLGTGDLHWFDITAKKQTLADTENPPEGKNADQEE